VPAGTKEGRAEDDRGTCIIVLGEPHGDGNAYRPINAPFWLLIGGWFFGALMYLSLYVQAPGVRFTCKRLASPFRANGARGMFRARPNFNGRVPMSESDRNPSDTA
jgi:hypothetical protein